MKKRLNLAFLSSLLFSLQACTPSPPLEQSYQNAVVDAAFVKKPEISTQLVVIDANNANLVWNNDKSKILVLTWKSKTAYEKFIKPNQKSSSNADYAFWVTTAPEVQKFCQHYLKKNQQASQADLELRLKQYLGLDKSWNYDVFVELWVSPTDLFRPCVDPEITDQQCELQFSKNNPQVKNIENYIDFYKNLYFKSFRASNGVPWTGLGYTYDWGNPHSSVGASEFILTPDSEYKVNRVVTTKEYCSAIQEK